ncbi:MAG: fasciclin domain-containing protein [Planctomycetes bacterium]|jgi:uncharacterized surface protein with fasciclin (FAS1) repeats|nr:fasciclin domain-containing protein [Planctomycetota bacterium]
MFKTTLLAIAGVAALTLGATYVPTASANCGACDMGTDHEHEKEAKTIVDIAAGDERFSTLVAAVKAAGLTDALSGEGPLTVFAPTNEAFAALPEGTLEELLKPENKDKLTSILTYHVAEGKVKAEKVVTMSEVPTLQGQTVKVEASGDGVKLNDSANVIKTDIMASNGVIHVIDAVLLPAAE